MSEQKTDKVGVVGAGIFGAFLVIQMVLMGIFVAVVSVVAVPLIYLGDFIDKKVFGTKEVDLADDPEWYRSGGRGTIF